MKEIFFNMQAKTTLPVLPRHIVRIVPVEQSIDQVRDGKIVFINAPAGCGKTTNIAAWVHKNSLPCAWVSLDAQSNSPRRFAQCLAASVTTNLLENKNDINIQDGDADMLVESILLYFAHLSSQVCIVFDDFHHINNPSVVSILQRLLRNIPLNVYIIISSRKGLPEMFYVLQTRQRIVEVTQKQLTFAYDEIQEFFDQKQIAASSKQILACLKYTQGWPLGLVAVSLAYKHSNSPIGYGGGSKYIYQFLHDEIWVWLDHDAKDFLIKTSIFDVFTSLLANEVAGINTSESILQNLCDSGAFTIRFGENKQLFSYHQVFRDFLKQQAKNANIDTVLLHNKAAAYFENIGDIVRAMTHYCHAQNTAGQMRLIQTKTAEVLSQIDMKQIIEIIDGMKPFRAMDNIETCVCYEWALQQIRKPKRAEAFIQTIEDNLSAQRCWMSAEQIKRVELEISAMKYPYVTVEKNMDKMLVCLKTMYMSKVDNPIVYSPDAIQSLYGCEYTLRDTASGFYGRHLFLVALLNKIENSEFKAMRQRLASSTFFNVSAAEVFYELDEIQKALGMLPDCIDHAVREKNFKAYLPAMLCLANIQMSFGKFSDAYDTVCKCRKTLEANSEYVAIRTLDAYKARIDILQSRGNEVQRYKAGLTISAHDDVSDISRHALYQYLSLLIALVKTRHWTLARLLCDNIIRMLNLLPDLVYKSQAMFLDAYICLKQDGKDMHKKIHGMLSLGFEDGYYRTFVDFGYPFRELIEYTAQTQCFSSNMAEYVQKLHHMSIEFTEKIKGDQIQITKREKDILICLAQDYSNQEIADAMHISLQTVKNYTYRLYQKLGVKKRMEAVGKARMLGLQEAEEQLLKSSKKL